MKSTLLHTLMIAAALLAAPGVLRAQSDATGLQLGGGQQENNEGTIDLGPAPRQAATPQQAPAAVPSGPALSGDVNRTVHGDWEVACAKSGAPCVMAQIGKDKAGTPILEMVVRKLPTPQEVQGVPVIAVTDIITPLGVVLTSGLVMQIDGGEQQRAPFQICTEQGCLVREPLTKEAVDRFIKGGNARITVVAAQQGPVSTQISLRGFTKAYQSLK